MQDNVTAIECRGWLLQIHTGVTEKGRYFEYKSGGRYLQTFTNMTS